MEGGISGYGMFGVPLQGSHVMCFFESGHLLQPRYFAGLPGKPTESPDSTKGFNDPDGVYPSSLNRDWHSLAHRNNWVIATHGGIIVEFDSSPGAEKIKLLHPSGKYIEIDATGNVNIVSNTTDITADTDISMDADADISMDSNAVDMTAATTITVTATGAVVITGSTVTIQSLSFTGAVGSSSSAIEINSDVDVHLNKP
jgi:hypothetical protein